MIHFDCLSGFKLQNFQNRSMTLLIEDYDINDFPCPFCRHYSNTIIPPRREVENLIQEISSKSISFEKYDHLTRMMTDFTDILTERTKSDNKTNMYINHCIQLADIKGLSWTLLEKPKLKSALLIQNIVNAVEMSKEDAESDFKDLNLYSTPFFKTNIS